MKLQARNLRPGMTVRTLTREGLRTIELWAPGPSPGSWWAIWEGDRSDVRTVTIMSLFSADTTTPETTR